MARYESGPARGLVITPERDKVLACFLHASFEWTAGEIAEMASLSYGRTVAILLAWEERGVFTSRWIHDGNRRKRVYRPRASD